ncbi:hypothetical protein LYNGBM3L_04260 [Moorena producens 3L]|uniref:Uncharacterized protein n=1 Tax=Moorena producens 3L TaxID=489825 RepID=F4XJ31_9CYAN|nr:hypothetical protein LYNGBM3L_04260 [Moorena producens 3L]
MADRNFDTLLSSVVIVYNEYSRVIKLRANRHLLAKIDKIFWYFSGAEGHLVSSIKLAEYPLPLGGVGKKPTLKSFAERLCKSRVSVGLCHNYHRGKRRTCQGKR